jgi:uncharacterized membrane protein YhaH (DUF805 family)
MNVYETPEANLDQSDNDALASSPFFSYKGRLGRIHFIGMGLVYFIISYLLGAFVIGLAIGISAAANTPIIGIVGGIVGFLGICYLTLHLHIRRLRDINASGWFCLLGFLPYLNLIYLLVLMVVPGTKGTNKYAQKPESASTAVTVLSLVFGTLIPVAFIGILAAIAIPAYQDYVDKSKAAAAQVQPMNDEY